MMRGWNDLGVVETIYEEEQEDFSNSPSLSPLRPTTSASAFSSLNSRVEEWSKATGLEADTRIHVQNRYFRVHKEPLTLKSRYLKRYLAESKEKSIYLPSCITAETFALVACFCYSQDIIITPYNIVSLRVAAQQLDMTEEEDDIETNLLQITESYFCQAVAVNAEYAIIMLHSCIKLLPEAEEMAFLVSRCIEALFLTERVDGYNDGLVDSIRAMGLEEFQMVADSMKERFTRNHDPLYKVVNLYIKEHNGKFTEEEKNQICRSVDCNKLSQQLLMHAVENSYMPLRFVIRAMLVEQLNTRQSIAIVSTDCSQRPNRINNDCVTLGAILQRDAALRYTAQLKSTMEATSARIVSLENELMSMKKRLQESDIKRYTSDSTRSASCRFSWEDKGERHEQAAAAALEKFSAMTPRGGKRLSQMLVGRFRNVFRMSKIDSTTRNMDRIVR